MAFKYVWAISVLGFAFLLALPRIGIAAITASFTGGSGSPVTVTLPQSVTYTITNAYNGSIAFVFPNAGNLVNDTFAKGTGTLTYLANGTTYTIDHINSGYTQTSPTPIGVNDSYIYSQANMQVRVGEVITVSAGILTTNNSFATTTLGIGQYDSYIVSGDGSMQVSSIGTAVPSPEPTVLSLLALVSMPLVRRR